MLHLLYTEWLKMRKYTAFWWMMGLTALSYPGINYIFYNVYSQLTQQSDKASQYAKMMLGNPFAFPEVWQTVAYFSSWFVFIPAVMVIMFISNEYSFKTHRQNIIDGWSRNEFITGKLLDVAAVTLIITILYIIVSLVTGSLNSTGASGKFREKTHFIGLFFLQTFAQLSIAFFIGFLLKKAFLALGVFLFYFLILENIIIGLLRFKQWKIANYLPLEISDRLIPRPGFMYLTNAEEYRKDLDAIPLHVALTLLLTSAIWFYVYRQFNRIDLK
ncbi:MAG: ABC transporter permease subunit [Chitinophagaceae bacterium]|nr:ABC transporter permease subunit [Chitinophagaceae bacterium]